MRSITNPDRDLPEIVLLTPPGDGLLLHLDRLVVDDLNTVETLAIVRVPLTEVARFVEALAQTKITSLSGSHLYALAQRLLSFFEFSFTPTASPELPIRVNLLLERICQQPPIFLPSFLRQVTEWFGFSPDIAVRRAWLDTIQRQPNEIGLPDPLRAYQERELAAVSDDEVLVPLVVLGAWRVCNKLPGWDMLPNLLHQLRHTLLRSRHAGLARQAYQQLTAFLRTTHPSLDGHMYRATRSRGVLMDLNSHDWSVGAPQPIIDAVLVALHTLYESDATRYQAVFNRVHGPVWDTVGRALNKLEGIESSYTPSESVTADPTSYVDSSRLVSHRLKSLAEAYTVLTDLETTLGVDRYLGGQALTSDLSLIHDRVQQIGEQTHQSLDSARQIYLRRWNLTNIASVILRLLGLGGGDGSLTDYFPSDHRRVIFLLVDALGYTQFQWFLDTVGQRAAAPLASNIFAWLREQKAFNDSYLLASNLVSITGSCLPTIYTGALPRETGVIGSHMMMEGHHLDVLHGTDERHKLKNHEVTEIYKRNVNCAIKPFAELADEAGVDVQAFHGGSMSFRSLTELSYGSLAKSGHVRRVRQPDRMFAEALPTVVSWTDTLEKKHLALFYYPLIDSSGHGCGPYTQFQTAELNKLNFVFTHFLVDLAHQAEGLFDGRTSVVITADHGMFESSTTVVSHHKLRNVLSGKMACGGMTFIYDNRAMYIYGVDQADLEAMRQEMADYFEAEGLPVAIATREDSLVTDLLCNPDSPWAANCPDLVLQFYGPGVFFRDDKLPSHMFLYGAHGGISVEETFVPLIHFAATPDLAVSLKQFL